MLIQVCKGIQITRLSRSEFVTKYYGNRLSHPITNLVVAPTSIRLLKPSSLVLKPRGIRLSSPENFDSIPGHGIEARVDQRPVLIGNKKLMLREKVQLSGLEERASTLAAEAKTAMYVAVDGKASAVNFDQTRIAGLDWTKLRVIAHLGSCSH